ncbi:hypothetical protein TNCV_2091031 [Trichonephila clavipes]|nr:hypothetical protein TNCV_2091031 [Trichonephila clavipes]
MWRHISVHELECWISSNSKNTSMRFILLDSNNFFQDREDLARSLLYATLSGVTEDILSPFLKLVLGSQAKYYKGLPNHINRRWAP